MSGEVRFMPCIDEKTKQQVRFRTEKIVGFQRHTAIFVVTVSRDSSTRNGCGNPSGAHPRIMSGLAKC
jgi:hypothetical protein